MTTDETKEEKAFSEEPVLSTEEVWSVLEFARSMAGMYGNMYLNPGLVSGRMRDITLNPVQATQDMLDDAMLSPKDSEARLQAFSQSFELTSMVYKRLLSYLSNMLAFDITYTSSAEKKDYNTPKYEKDLKGIENFLDRFEYKKEFRTVVREMLRNDAYFACVRDTKDNNIVLQELPSEYCKITGRWSGGFLFSFDMYWFLRPGVDINMYPSFFKKKYKEIWKDPSGIKNYNPSLSPEDRGRSSWVYWVDIPVSVGACFKLSPELATRLPYFTPIFNDLILQPTMRTLQKNMNMAAASKIIMGSVPLLNKEAKATVRDTIAISPDLLGKFMALVKSAISDSVKVASAPLENIRGISFDTDNEMYDSYLRTALASTGINTNLIFTSGVKPNAIETQLSLNVDEQFMCMMYEQFNDFINYWGNKYAKTFEFKFAFEGTEFFLNREDRLDKAMTLFDKGIILPQKIAAAIGIKPATLRKHMEESAATGFMDLLTTPTHEQAKEMMDIQNEQAEKLADKQAAVVKVAAPSIPKPASETAKTSGRPKKKISDLGEEGMKTRETGGNIGRGGKIP